MELLATDSGLGDALRVRGLKRVEQFRWENTARATLEVYRSVVLRPSARSLNMRRHLRDAIIRWSEPKIVPESAIPIGSPPLGIRNALGALNTAVHSRLGRELGRFRLVADRKTA
jgi:hypothetical protein